MVGRPDDLTGEAICAFVVLKRALPAGDEAKTIAKGTARLGPRKSAPLPSQRHPLWGKPPKTRSGGKIMRRLLRSWPRARPLRSDTSTLENPAILGQLVKPTESLVHSNGLKPPWRVFERTMALFRWLDGIGFALQCA